MASVRREECNFILLFSPVYPVHGREVWHECELVCILVLHAYVES